MTAERHYEVIKLAPRGFRRGDGWIDLDLDEPGAEKITNDAALLSSRSREGAVWVSGGGTIVLARRYVPLVRRKANAPNAGLLSLFTGRADGRDEWISPCRLVRELVEEMVLCDSGGRPIWPDIEGQQDVVDAAWHTLRSAEIVSGTESLRVQFEPLQLPLTDIAVRSCGAVYRDSLFCHINSANEINVLFAFAAALDPEGIIIRDGEFHRAGNEIVKHERNVVLYDMVTQTIHPVGRKNETRSVRRSEMTEHLQALLDALHQPI